MNWAAIGALKTQSPPVFVLGLDSVSLSSGLDTDLVSIPFRLSLASMSASPCLGLDSGGLDHSPICKLLNACQTQTHKNLMSDRFPSHSLNSHINSSQKEFRPSFSTVNDTTGFTRLFFFVFF